MLKQKPLSVPYCKPASMEPLDKYQFAPVENTGSNEPSYPDSLILAEYPNPKPA